MNENVSAVVINLVDNGGGSIGMVFEMWEHIQGGYNGNPAYFMIEDEINPMSSRLQFNQPFVFNSYYNSMLGISIKHLTPKWMPLSMAKCPH